MKYLPSNTLAHFNAAPQHHAMNLGMVPTGVLGAATQDYRKDCGTVSPDEIAVKFYALNHCASIIHKKFTQNEPLPYWAQGVMKEYQKMLVHEGNRMMHYTISIITREARHLGTSGAPFWSALEKNFGPEFKKIMQHIDGVQENQAVEAYMKSGWKISLHNYVNGLSYVFNHGKWASGFGGKAWAKVSETLAAFIDGKTSQEMMMDTAFTLAHNNGPIFNKGMMYTHYTDKFIAILDVQRSGQIPELLLDKQDYGLSRPADAASICQSVADNVEDAFGPYLDWTKVEALGAVHKYPSYKSMQQKAHPSTEAFTLKGGHKIKVVGDWDVFPGQSVKKYQRVKSAV